MFLEKQEICLNESIFLQKIAGSARKKRPNPPEWQIQPGSLFKCAPSIHFAQFRVDSAAVNRPIFGDGG